MSRNIFGEDIQAYHISNERLLNLLEAEVWIHQHRRNHTQHESIRVTFFNLVDERQTNGYTGTVTSPQLELRLPPPMEKEELMFNHNVVLWVTPEELYAAGLRIDDTQSLLAGNSEWLDPQSVFGRVTPHWSDVINRFLNWAFPSIDWAKKIRNFR